MPKNDREQKDFIFVNGKPDGHYEERGPLGEVYVRDVCGVFEEGERKFPESSYMDPNLTEWKKSIKKSTEEER